MTTQTITRPARPQRSGAGPRRPRRYTRMSVIAGVSAYLVTFLIAFPLLWITVLSFQPSGNVLSNRITTFSLENYVEAFRTLPLLRMYGNTLLLAVASVTGGAVFAFMLSFGLVTMVFRWPALQSALRYYVLAGLAVPIYILLFPVYRLDLLLGLFGSYWALIVPYVAVSIPFNTLLFTGFLRDLPHEIKEAAVIDGVGLFTLVWRVVVPLMRPAIMTVVIFNFIYVFNEFPFVSILLADRSMITVSLAVSQFQGQYTANYGGMMAAAVITLIPQLIIYFVFQKQVVAGMTVGAVKG